MNNFIIPSLYFSNKNTDWKQERLGDLVSIYSGWTPSEFKIADEHFGYMFIKVDDLNRTTREQTTSKIHVEEHKRLKKIKKGSIIFPKRGAAIMTNKIRILKKESYMDTNMMSLEAKNIDINFLYSLLQKEKLYKIADTSTLPQINNKHIEPYLIYLPSMNEQKKIGSFFKNLDDTIALHQQELESLKQTKQGFLQKMFPREGQLIPIIRFNEFKDNWAKKLLEQKGKLRSGIGFSEIEQGGTEGIPFYKVSDMNHRDNKMKMKIANNYVTDQQIKSKKWSVIEEVPAIIFAKVGAALMLNRKKLVTTSFLIDNNLMSYSFNSEWDSYFGYTLFQTIFLPKYAQVGALPSFNISDVSNIEILLPSYNEQVKIGKFFRQLDEVIELKEKELEVLKQTKKGFLQKMFV